MIKKIHHVGLAVHNADVMVKLLEEVFGAKQIPNYTLETKEFLSRMVQVGENAFELLEPRGKNGLIERFLNNRGEGIHHVSLEVDNLDELLKICEAKGITVMDRRFIHPKSTHGVLIELVEPTQRPS